MVYNCLRRHHTTGAFWAFFLFLTVMLAGPVRAVEPKTEGLSSTGNDEPCPPIVVQAAPCAAAAALRHALHELDEMLRRAANVEDVRAIQRRIHCTTLALTGYQRLCEETGEEPPPGRPLPTPGPSPGDPGPSMCPPLMLPDAPCAAAAMLRDKLEGLEKQLARAQTPGEAQSIQHQMHCVKTDYGRYEQQCAGEGSSGQPGKPLPGPSPEPPEPSICPEEELAAWMRQDPCGLLSRLNAGVEDLQRQLAGFPPPDVPVTGVMQLQRSMVERKLRCYLGWMERVRQAVSTSDPTICGTVRSTAFSGGPPLHERVPASPSATDPSHTDPSHVAMCEELNRRLQDIMGRINRGQPVQGTVMLQLRQIESRIGQFCTGHQPATTSPGRTVPIPVLDQRRP